MHTHFFRGAFFCLNAVVLRSELLCVSIVPNYLSERFGLVPRRNASLRSFASHKEHSTLQSPEDRASARKKKKKKEPKTNPTQNKTPETNKARAQRLEAAA